MSVWDADKPPREALLVVCRAVEPQSKLGVLLLDAGVFVALGSVLLSSLPK